MCSCHTSYTHTHTSVGIINFSPFLFSTDRQTAIAVVTLIIKIKLTQKKKKKYNKRTTNRNQFWLLLAATISVVVCPLSLSLSAFIVVPVQLKLLIKCALHSRTQRIGCPLYQHAVNVVSNRAASSIIAAMRKCVWFEENPTTYARAQLMYRERERDWNHNRTDYHLHQFAKIKKRRRNNNAHAWTNSFENLLLWFVVVSPERRSTRYAKRQLLLFVKCMHLMFRFILENLEQTDRETDNDV